MKMSRFRPEVKMTPCTLESASNSSRMLVRPCQNPRFITLAGSRAKVTTAAPPGRHSTLSPAAAMPACSCEVNVAAGSCMTGRSWVAAGSRQERNEYVVSARLDASGYSARHMTSLPAMLVS